MSELYISSPQTGSWLLIGILLFQSHSSPLWSKILDLKVCIRSGDLQKQAGMLTRIVRPKAPRIEPPLANITPFLGEPFAIAAGSHLDNPTSRIDSRELCIGARRMPYNYRRPASISASSRLFGASPL